VQRCNNYLNISLGNCGRSRRIGFWKNGCITLGYNREKYVLYYNNKTNKIELRTFERSSNVYSVRLKKEFNLDNFNFSTMKSILSKIFIESCSNENRIFRPTDKLIQNVIDGIVQVCGNSTDPDLIIVKDTISNLIPIIDIQNIQNIQNIPDTKTT
jgi:hypothetical protein